MVLCVLNQNITWLYLNRYMRCQKIKHLNTMHSSKITFHAMFIAGRCGKLLLKKFYHSRHLGFKYEYSVIPNVTTKIQSKLNDFFFSSITYGKRKNISEANFRLNFFVFKREKLFIKLSLMLSQLRPTRIHFLYIIVQAI